jgi:kynurenine formamidase
VDGTCSGNACTAGVGCSPPRRTRRRSERELGGSSLSLSLGLSESERMFGCGGCEIWSGRRTEAADFLLDERRVTAIGVDTLSLDHGPSTTFTVHVNWLGPTGTGWRTSPTSATCRLPAPPRWSA